MSRFEGDRGRERLKEVLQAQPLLCCDHGAVEHIAASTRRPKMTESPPP